MGCGLAARKYFRAPRHEVYLVGKTMIAGRLVNLFRSGLFWVAVAAAGTAAGCHDHLYDFGVGVIPVDAGSVATDGSTKTDGRVMTVDAHPGGSGGHAGGAGGAGGSAGTSGAGGTGGIQTCNPNSIDLQTDVANCGTCFHQCIVPNATPACVKGACQFTCEAGFFDADKDPSNGCECTKTNGGIEICDGLDNDCNGIVDDGFDFQTDVNNCGGCNRQCAFPFATASCVAGVCTQGACLPDFYDRDPTMPGCETECIMTNGGVEICDGLDNDCDGVVDDNLQPATITCLTQGVCAGVLPTCHGQNGWCCVYPSTYETLEDTALGCDTLDNDCDGQTDEAFNDRQVVHLGSGPCAGTGIWVCDNSQPGDHRCMGSTRLAGVEVCNGIDDDCDGLVDELDSRPTGPPTICWSTSHRERHDVRLRGEPVRRDLDQQRLRFDPPGLLPPRQAPLVERHDGGGRGHLCLGGTELEGLHRRRVAGGLPGRQRHHLPLREHLRGRGLQRERLLEGGGRRHRGAHPDRQRQRDLRVGHLDQGEHGLLDQPQPELLDLRHERQRQGVDRHRSDVHQAAQQPPVHDRTVPVRDARRCLRHRQLHGHERHDHHHLRPWAAVQRLDPGALRHDRRRRRHHDARDRRPLAVRGLSLLPTGNVAAMSYTEKKRGPTMTRQLRLELVLLAAVTCAAAAPARAQSLRPNIMFLFDTSGSMHEDSNLVDRADGTTVCPQSTTSRIYSLKSGIRQALQEVGTDEANFGLMSFPQTVQNAYTMLTANQCTNTGQSPIGHYVAAPAQTMTVTNRTATAFHDASTYPAGCLMTTNNSATQTTYDTWFTSGASQVFEVGVTSAVPGTKPTIAQFDPPGATQMAAIYKWIDNNEAPTSAGAVTDPELHPKDDTPLGRSLFYANLYFQNEVVPIDPKGSCRHNVMVVVTDGDDTCDDATAPDSTFKLSDCSAGGNYDVYNPVSQACLLNKLGVKVYVITDTTADNLNDTIAAAGGTGASIRVSLRPRRNRRSSRSRFCWNSRRMTSSSGSGLPSAWRFQ